MESSHAKVSSVTRGFFLEGSCMRVCRCTRCYNAPCKGQKSRRGGGADTQVECVTEGKRQMDASPGGSLRPWESGKGVAARGGTTSNIRTSGAPHEKEKGTMGPRSRPGSVFLLSEGQTARTNFLAGSPVGCRPSGDLDSRCRCWNPLDCHCLHRR